MELNSHDNKLMLSNGNTKLTNSDHGKSTRLTRSRANRRSLSGAPLTCLFETKFQHLKAFQKKQNETRGINFLLTPNTPGAFYRSSLPVTPIATPLFSRSIKFTEQSLHERILNQSQSSRRNRFHSTFNDQNNDIKEVPESQLSIAQQSSTTNQTAPQNSK